MEKEQKIELINSRNIIALNKLNTIKLVDDYSELTFFRNELFLVSYEEKNQGKLYRYNKQKKTVELYKDFNKKGQKTIIGEYYIKDKNDSLIFFYKNNANNSFRSLYKDEELYDKKFKIVIQRIFFKDNENAIVTTWGKTYQPEYYKYNLKNEKLIKINFDHTVLKNIKYPGVALDGKFSSNDNTIFLTSYSQNIVLLFDLNMNYLNSFRLNYKNPRFNILNTEKNNPVIDPTNITPNISFDVDNNSYYVLTNKNGDREGRGTYFIDRYNLKNKKYETSLKIEVIENDLSPKEISVRKGYIYVLSKKNIDIYERGRF